MYYHQYDIIINSIYTYTNIYYTSGYFSEDLIVLQYFNIIRWYDK